jgi:acyl carrier protein
MGRERTVSITEEVVSILVSVLNLKGKSARFTADTPLLGHIQELDSMAVVGVISAIEERFGFAVDDDEIDGSTFATVGSLAEFVRSKLQA